MKNKIDVDRVPDIQFLQRMGTALFLLALAAGSVTVIGAANLP